MATQAVAIAGDLYSELDVQTKVVVPQLAAAGYRDATRDIKISYQRPITAQQGREQRTIYADIVVEVSGQPMIVVDSKSPRQFLTDNDREQVISYARLLGNIAPYAVLCNGRVWRVYDSISKQQLVRLPTYSELKSTLRTQQHVSEKQRISLAHQATRTLLAIDSARELSRLMRRCHDVIRNLKGYDPTRAFDELSKLLFAKMYEEREIEDGNRKENRFTIAVVQRERHNGVEIIQNLWRDTIRSRRYRDVFSDEDEKDEIDLPPAATDKIVAILEDKSLGKTDLDVKGVAFEEFLSATYRGGGLGQYFTPREVVNFMVDLVNPRIGDRTVDPSCGSGGFLIRVYDQVRDKILTSDMSAREQAHREKELSTSLLAGIDWEPRAARTCKMNMIIHGDGHAGVYQGNALDIEEIDEKVEKRRKFCPDAPTIQDNTFEIILTNPPFGARDDQQRILQHYELGGNSQKREVLLIERCIRLLRPGGRMAAVIPEGILSNKGDKKIRDYIRTHCIVKAVIRLPQDAFKMSEGAACTSVLYVVKKDDTNPALAKQGDIFFARAEYIGISPSGGPIEQNDLPAIREQFLRFEHGSWDGIELRPSLPHRMEIVREEPVSGDDWLEPEVNRTSLLYDRLSYVIRDPQISNRFSYTYNHPKYYRLMNAIDAMPVDVGSLESLCVEGYPRRGKIPKEEAAEGIPILKVRNITGDGISKETEFAPDTDEVREYCANAIVAKGDLLITSTGEGTIGRVDAYMFEEPAIADGHVTICRLRQDVSRRYVQEFLKSEFGQIQMLRQVIGSTGQTELLRGDISALRVPIPEPDIQARIVREMEEARTRSAEFVNGARYLRERGAAILASARTRMIGVLSGSADTSLAEEQPHAASDIASRFRAYAELWRRQTIHMSSVSKMISHPAYRSIVEMGRDALPLIFEELRDRPDHWLAALHQITSENPARSESTFTEAIESWLSWGRERGYLR